MGLDIYAGKLTRYYSRNWKNIVQLFAEENGQNCVMRDASGNEMKPVEDQAEIENIRDIVSNWADTLAVSIKPPLTPPIWDEKSDCGYFTDKPDWVAFGALVMLQACIELKKPLPEFVRNGWNFYDEPIVKQAMEQRIPNSLLMGTTHWLPIPDEAIYIAKLPTGNEGTISTVSLLKYELEDLNKQLWNADEDTILSWRNDKFYVPLNRKRPKLVLGFIQQFKKKDRYSTEELAKCAYSMLYQAVKFATENQCPIVLDY